MKLYECIVDDGVDVFKTFTAAKNKKELLSVYGGNGSFEKIKDITNDYFTDDTPVRLASDLQRCGWGRGEVELIKALVEEHIRKLNR